MTSDQLERANRLKVKQERLAAQLQTLRTHTGTPAFLEALRNMSFVPDSVIQGLRTQLQVHFESEAKQASDELAAL
jgi:hypothetical protein